MNVSQQLLIIVDLLEAAEIARRSGNKFLMNVALNTIKHLLLRRYPVPFHTLN